MANTKILNAELDFDTLKDSIKTHLSQYSEFADYDFDASGLNIFIEALAYNTHQLAKIGNFTLNESFLDTAQLRSSVVSHAKTLGYTPRSRTAATATINVTALAVPNGTATLTLPKHTAFTTTIDGDSYSFYTLDEYTADSSTNYVFENVMIKEGMVKTKRFFVDGFDETYPVYIVPDASMDTSTVSLILRESVGSSSITTLALATTVAELDAESDIYLINEAPNGNWEFTLGDGIIGRRPTEGEVLEVTYLATAGDAANGAQTFATTATVSGLDLSVALVSRSAGGATKEDIESIRYNGPLTFSAQNRLVTKEDYISFINRNLSFVDTLNIWGGEDNVPVDYGTVYLSIKPIGADAMTTAQQAEVTNLLAGKSVLNVEPVYVNPTFQYFDITCQVRYDPNKTSLSKQQLETQVANTITNYGTTNLRNFGTSFYKSNLTTTIDESDEAIITSNVTVNVRKRFFPTINALDVYTVPFTMPVKNPASSTTSVVTSTGFLYEIGGVNFTCFIRNKVGSSTLEMFRLSSGSEIIVSTNVGSINSSDNTLTIGPFQPRGFSNATKGIEFIITPANDLVISPLRNQLLVIDTDATAVTATPISG